MNKLKPVPIKIPTSILRFISQIKKENKILIYETFILFMLHEDFLEKFEISLLDNLEKFSFAKLSQKKAGSMLKIYPSKGLEKVIDSVCKSDYFIENFTNSEIQKRKVTINTAFANIVLDTLTQTISEKKAEAPTLLILLDYPGISHTILNEKDEKEFQLRFYESTPLKDLIKYLKENMKIKNNPEKKKIKLGLGYKFLQEESFIRANKEKYKTGRKIYSHTHIYNELKKHFRIPSVDSLKKTGDRIKKIRKQINTIKKDK